MRSWCDSWKVWRDAGGLFSAPLRRCDNPRLAALDFAGHERCADAGDDEDDRPKKKIAHEIGQDLTLLSVAELNERIALLQEEIARLEADIARKQSSRSAADQFFKK